MNVSYDNEELKPFMEPEQDFSDLNRIGPTRAHAHAHTHTHTINPMIHLVHNLDLCFTN